MKFPVAVNKWQGFEKGFARPANCDSCGQQGTTVILDSQDQHGKYGTAMAVCLSCLIAAQKAIEAAVLRESVH